MKVLLLHNRYKLRGGEDVVFDRERVLLQQLGVTVEQLIVTNDQINTPLASAKAALNCAYSEEGRRLTSEKIQSFQPDLVHAHNTFPLLTRSVWTACAEQNIPLVQTLHNYRLFCANAVLLRNGKPCTLCLDQKPWRAVAYGCYRDSKIASIPVAHMIDRQLNERAWEQVPLFICITEFAKSLFIKLGIPSEKIRVKMNFAPDLRQELGESADSNGQDVIYFGRLSEEKGLSTLAAAWKTQEFSLRVLGQGPMASSLKNAGIHVEPNFSQEESWRAMARARCLVVPTECYEGGFPLVIPEALSLGLPVIATAIGGIPDYLNNGETAILVPPRDPASLADAVHRLAHDDELWSKLSINGRMLFEERFTAKTCGENLLGAYAQVLGRDPQPFRWPDAK